MHRAFYLCLFLTTTQWWHFDIFLLSNVKALGRGGVFLISFQYPEFYLYLFASTKSNRNVYECKHGLDAMHLLLISNATSPVLRWTLPPEEGVCEGTSSSSCCAPALWSRSRSSLGGCRSTSAAGAARSSAARPGPSSDSPGTKTTGCGLEGFQNKVQTHLLRLHGY